MLSLAKKNTISKDLKAGTVVFLVAIPLCLGIALASGAPPLSGLLSGIIGGLLVGILSGSQTSVSGPAAGLAAVVASQILILGDFQLFLTAVFIAGLIQILFGIFRGGFIAAFFPNCVIKGLLFSIGLLLILKQIPHLFGHDSDPEGDFAFYQINNENTFSSIFSTLNHLHLGAMLLGLLSLLVLIYGPKLNLVKKSKIPVPLLVIAVAMLGNLLFQLFVPHLTVGNEHLVALPDISSLAWRDFFFAPNLSALISDSRVISAAIMIAVIASLETLLNIDAVDQLDKKQRVSPPNRELFAQGIGNTIAGLVGALPITSVIVRSSVNLSNKNATKLSAIWHGILLLLSLLFFSQVMNLIPLSSLAAILLVTGTKLANPKLVQEMWVNGKNQWVPFAVTVGGIILTDLLIGIALGLVCSILFILHSNFHKTFFLEKSGDKNIFKLPQQVSFLAKASLKRELDKIPENTTVIFDGQINEYIDLDIIDMIHDFKNKSDRKNILVELIDLKKYELLKSKTEKPEQPKAKIGMHPPLANQA